ncbi:hypothetical protein R3P38DRAFT_3438665 [Favolaschia claudopus]|uniref:Uncharacterized protein n=1 Tax=Favolaschia claudopus TaxID=2862362 RepID=A0AAV9ZSF2_9AGAR
MHAFELGVFKAFFIHLLRILYAHGDAAISKLNERFRMVPTFGRSTIRRFTQNTSALKKLAAWNYEDILLCSIPVIEDLLPEPWNSDILDLLFTFAEWHSLAKLKLHTETTVGLLRSMKKAAQGKGKGRAGPASKADPKVKVFSLETYKLHELGDYAPYIPWIGTMDNVSTQPGELEHRRVRKWYARTNKNQAVRQITQLERRETALLRIASRARINARRI